MANETPEGRAPKPKRTVVRWPLASDPAIRWRTMRDPTEQPDEPVAATPLLYRSSLSHRLRRPRRLRLQDSS